MTTHRSDAEIQKDILAELKWDPQIKETDIGIIVKEGAVTLTGNVPFYSHKYAAKNAAKRIKGVRVVADEIQIKSAQQMEGSDEDIAQHIARIFEWNSQIPGDDIKADVKDGIVILSGNVDWQYQRKYIQNQVEAIRGVASVVNSIALRQRVLPYDVKKEITRALHRHANLEVQHVSISVVDGTVTLSGNVDTYQEKDLIKHAVWMAPGVIQIIDNLTIRPRYSAAA